MVSQHVIKRDGRVVAFDFDKICQAMAAAGAASGSSMRLPLPALRILSRPLCGDSRALA